MYGHTSTTLPNGKVLIAGYDAELFDPTLGHFSLTGSMGQSRSYATATLLPNGKVLIAGGDVGGSGSSSALLYDPSTGLFSSTGPMTQGRRMHEATLLSNGMVLITGGEADASGQTSLASCELYNPSTGNFFSTGSLLITRSGHTATLLPSNKVLITGGYSIGGATGYLASAETYDPTTSLFSYTSSMQRAKDDHAATLLSNGQVLIAGGADYNSRLANAELY
jgi:hypothetical protein